MNKTPCGINFDLGVIKFSTQVKKIIFINTLPRKNLGLFLDASTAFAKISKPAYPAEIIFTNQFEQLKDIDIIFIAASLEINSQLKQECLMLIILNYQ